MVFTSSCTWNTDGIGNHVNANHICLKNAYQLITNKTIHTNHAIVYTTIIELHVNHVHVHNANFIFIEIQ